MDVDRGGDEGNRRMIGKFHAFRKACGFGSVRGCEKIQSRPALRAAVTLRAGGGCAAISASLVVSDATASPPPRSLISQRKLHQRGPLWIFSQPLTKQSGTTRPGCTGTV